MLFYEANTAIINYIHNHYIVSSEHEVNLSKLASWPLVWSLVESVSSAAELWQTQAEHFLAVGLLKSERSARLCVSTSSLGTAAVHVVKEVHSVCLLGLHLSLFSFIAASFFCGLKAMLELQYTWAFDAWLLFTGLLLLSMPFKVDVLWYVGGVVASVMERTRTHKSMLGVTLNWLFCACWGCNFVRKAPSILLLIMMMMMMISPTTNHHPQCQRFHYDPLTSPQFFLFLESLPKSEFCQIWSTNYVFFYAS